MLPRSLPSGSEGLAVEGELDIVGTLEAIARGPEITASSSSLPITLCHVLKPIATVDLGSARGWGCDERNPVGIRVLESRQ